MVCMENYVQVNKFIIHQILISLGEKKLHIMTEKLQVYFKQGFLVYHITINRKKL